MTSITDPADADQLTNQLSTDQFSTDHAQPETEQVPGLVITRRRLLWLSPLAAAALTFDPSNLKAQSMTGPGAGSKDANKNQSSSEIGWDEFVKQCLPIAQELHRDTSNSGQDAYLLWLATMIARVRLKEMPRAKLGRFSTLEPAVNFGVSYRGQPFFIVEWWLEPGATLPPHCHPNASVCTFGIEGEARLRNFEIVGQAPGFESKQTFQVRETHNEIIAPGRLNTLSALRDNIHTFQAGKQGARGVDISTYHGPNVGFSFLDIGDKPREAEQRIYEAAWKKIE